MSIYNIKYKENILYCILGFVSVLVVSWLLFLFLNVFFFAVLGLLICVGVVLFAKKVRHKFFSGRYNAKEENNPSSKTIETEYHVINDEEK